MTASTIERRISPWVIEWNASIVDIPDRPDAGNLQGGDVVYVLKDIFTTINGSWEPSNQPGSIPQWARDDYLSSDFANAGGDHNLFAAAIGLDGQLMKQKGMFFWSDGIEQLGNPDYTGYNRRDTDPTSGWADIPIFAPPFYPDQGQSGPWCWSTVGPADVLCGGGLPYNQHVSWFAVWQQMRREDYEGGGNGGDGGTTELEARIAMLEYRLARLEALHMVSPPHGDQHTHEP